LPAVTTYRIEAPTKQVEVSKAQQLKPLRVGRIQVAIPYDQASLVYRLSTVRFSADPYHAFLAEPAPMLADQIAEWLMGTGLLKEADGRDGTAPTARVLEATVTELYGDFEEGGAGAAAVMSVHFTVVNQEGVRPRVEYERLLARRIPLSSASPEELVRGYGTALAEILGQLATDLSIPASQ
jgi:hypothetical protein